MKTSSRQAIHHYDSQSTMELFYYIVWYLNVSQQMSYIVSFFKHICTITFLKACAFIYLYNYLFQNYNN